MANSMKRVAMDAITAAKKGFDEMLKGKGGGDAVDANIEAAAQTLDNARTELENKRAADRARALEPGHQLRARLVLDHINEYGGIRNMDVEDLVELFSPLSFDPTVEIIARHMTGWDNSTAQKLGVVKNLFEEVRTRNNAIAVLSAQAERLRGLPGVLGSAESLDADTVRRAFDGVLEALNGWNDELSVYGG